jgi:hypothetical protein
MATYTQIMTDRKRLKMDTAAAEFDAMGGGTIPAFADHAKVTIAAAKYYIKRKREVGDWDYGWPTLEMSAKVRAPRSILCAATEAAKRKREEEIKARLAACQALEGRFFERKPRPPQTNAEACAAMLKEWRHRTRRTRSGPRTREVAA